MQQAQDNFSESVTNTIGIKLSDRELAKVYQTYGASGKDGFNKSKFLKDLKSKLRELSHKNDPARTLQQVKPKFIEIRSGPLTTPLENILVKIKESICRHFPGETSHNELIQRGLQLFGDSRMAVYSRHQLRFSFSSRLGLLLTDESMEELFRALDPMCTGEIKLKLLLAMAVDQPIASKASKGQPASTTTKTSAMDPRPPSASSGSGPSVISGLQNDLRPSTASGSTRGDPDMQQTSVNDFLAPPKPSVVRIKSVFELEELVREKVKQRCRGGNMTRCLLHCFGGDTRNKDINHEVISRAQFGYSLRQILHLHVSDVEIEVLFNKFKDLSTDSIPLLLFAKAICTEGEADRPLIVDRNELLEMDIAAERSASVLHFFQVLRSKLKQMVNQQCRAPHYLLHAIDTMTTPQAIKFLKKTLHMETSQDLWVELAAIYNKQGLVDMKRILREAIDGDSYTSTFASGDRSSTSTSDSITGGGGGATLHGKGSLDCAVITIDDVPKSLRLVKKSNNQWKELLCSKLLQKTRGHQPLSVLHNHFRESGQKESTHCSKEKLFSVFRDNDIIISREDFDHFFADYDCGDGTFELRSFLVDLMPKNDINSNPVAPRDKAEMDYQQALNATLTAVTGTCRPVSYLQGSVHARRTLDDNGETVVVPQEGHGLGQRQEQRQEQSGSAVVAVLPTDKTDNGASSSNQEVRVKQRPASAGTNGVRHTVFIPSPLPMSPIKPDSEVIPVKNQVSFTSTPSPAPVTSSSSSSSSSSSTVVGGPTGQSIHTGHAVPIIHLTANAHTQRPKSAPVKSKSSVKSKTSAVSGHHPPVRSAEAAEAVSDLSNYENFIRREHLRLVLEQLQEMHTEAQADGSPVVSLQGDVLGGPLKLLQESAIRGSHHGVAGHGVTEVPSSSSPSSSSPAQRPASAPTVSIGRSPRRPQQEAPSSSFQRPATATATASRSPTSPSGPPQPPSVRLDSSTLRNTESSPRSNGSTGGNFSPRSPRTGRFVETGQPREPHVSMESPLLKHKYHMTKGRTSTAAEEYGLFVKTYQKTIKNNQNHEKISLAHQQQQQQQQQGSDPRSKAWTST